MVNNLRFLFIDQWGSPFLLQFRAHFLKKRKKSFRRGPPLGGGCQVGIVVHHVAFSRAGGISKIVLQEYRLENRTKQGRYQEWLTAHQSEIALTLKASSRALRHWCAVNKMARRSILFRSGVASRRFQDQDKPDEKKVPSLQWER
ncbi:hypothetical protein L484_010794 [Morus notabilis]|uniref:Uncharacterized protein n=1 Tax=Morus notabilis TaxID=981085 RepID=W9SAS4_9ROSA|nr:hypothetical protein L484_010794 [Morus notabilis]